MVKLPTNGNRYPGFKRWMADTVFGLAYEQAAAG